MERNERHLRAVGEGEQRGSGGIRGRDGRGADSLRCEDDRRDADERVGLKAGRGGELDNGMPYDGMDSRSDTIVAEDDIYEEEGEYEVGGASAGRRRREDARSNSIQSIEISDNNNSAQNKGNVSRLAIR